MAVQRTPFVPRRLQRSRSTYHQRFRVSFDYPVVFTRHVFLPENPVLARLLSRREPGRRHRAVVVVDDGVAGAWPDLDERILGYARRHSATLELAAPIERVPGGETAKNDPEVVRRLLGRFHSLRLDRQSFVVIVGGGAVLDAVGYAAAVAHRGLRVVRVPTTVLAQNDSGVGVKNAVNAFGTKNLLGTFAPPFGVVNDAAFLDGLGERDRREGMAEAVKVALIRDAAFFAWIEASAGALAALEPDALGTLVRRCAELHLRHIASSGDPFELGSARPLDFGHWSAHKLETLTAHALRHGEAVAIGVALDARHSVEAGRFPADDGDRVVALLERLGLPTWHPALDQRDAAGRPVVLDGLADFREHLGGELTLTLLDGIGHGVDTTSLSEAAILRSLAWLRARQRPR